MTRISITLIAFVIACVTYASAEDLVPDVSPIISKKGTLLFEDDFDETTKKPKWYGKHGTQWEVVNGALRGGPSSKEFQQKRIAKGDAAHSGRSPAGRLLVPTDDCIVLFRFKMSNGLSEAHFGFDDGSKGTGHLARFIVSTKKGIAIQRDMNAKVKGEKNRVLVSKEVEIKPDTWHWMMLEVVGNKMVGQISGGAVLEAEDERFDMSKGHINLPNRGHGGTIYYDHVRVWKAR